MLTERGLGESLFQSLLWANGFESVFFIMWYISSLFVSSVLWPVRMAGHNIQFPYGPEGLPWVAQMVKNLRKIPWRREWLPPPVFLPGESHGQRSLEGCSPEGCRESETTEWLSTWPLSVTSFRILRTVCCVLRFIICFACGSSVSWGSSLLSAVRPLSFYC